MSQAFETGAVQVFNNLPLTAQQAETLTNFK